MTPQPIICGQCSTGTLEPIGGQRYRCSACGYTTLPPLSCPLCYEHPMQRQDDTSGTTYACRNCGYERHVPAVPTFKEVTGVPTLRELEQLIRKASEHPDG